MFQPTLDDNKLQRAIVEYAGLAAGSPEATAIAESLSEVLPYLITLIKHGYGHATINVFKHEFDSVDLTTRHKALGRRRKPP
jgi:hypothetical protein